MQHQNNLDQTKALSFIVGGNALFTVKSIKTGQRFTYKVLAHSKIEDLLHVSILNGTDNTKNYKPIGEINIENFMPMFKPLSVHTKDEPGTKAFSHILRNLSIERPMPMLEIWHEGRCCRCGRLLTVPESIANGIGPECIFKQSKITI